MNVSDPIKVENGDIVRIYPGNSPEVYDKAPYGRIYLDGKIGVDEDYKSIKERKNISTNGFINIVLIITSKGNIYETPIITLKGIPVSDKEELELLITHEIEKITKTFSLNNKKQEENLYERLKLACRKVTKEKTGKKPLTNINLVRI